MNSLLAWVRTLLEPSEPDNCFADNMIEWLQAPSLYLSMGMIIASGWTPMFLRAIDFIPHPVAPGTPIAWHWQNVVIGGIGAVTLITLLAAPFVFIGAVHKAAKTENWKFVTLDVIAGLFWLAGL